MKIVRYEHEGFTGFGALDDGLIAPMDGELADLRPAPSRPSVAMTDVRLLSPTVPSKIIAIGPNYAAHFVALDFPPPPQPMLWTKPPTCRNDPEGVIELPPGHTVNHEVELGIVIGKTARRVTEASANDYILGYTCVNDVTAGDFETPGAFPASHYYVDGKIFDGFAPIGPCIVTDLDPRDLSVVCRVNGEVRQDERTSDFLFSPAYLVALISDVMTLYPGDVISTGSPPGVRPIVHGDVIEVEIEGIGILRNHVRNRV